MGDETVTRKLWTVEEVAWMLRVTKYAVLNWIRKGKIIPCRQPQKHRYLIRDDVLAEFIQRHYKPGRFIRRRGVGLVTVAWNCLPRHCVAKYWRGVGWGIRPSSQNF